MSLLELLAAFNATMKGTPPEYHVIHNNCIQFKNRFLSQLDTSKMVEDTGMVNGGPNHIPMDIKLSGPTGLICWLSL